MFIHSSFGLDVCPGNAFHVFTADESQFKIVAKSNMPMYVIFDFVNFDFKSSGSAKERYTCIKICTDHSVRNR